MRLIDLKLTIEAKNIRMHEISMLIFQCYFLVHFLEYIAFSRIYKYAEHKQSTTKFFFTKPCTVSLITVHMCMVWPCYGFVSGLS